MCLYRCLNNEYVLVLVSDKMKVDSLKRERLDITAVIIEKHATKNTIGSSVNKAGYTAIQSRTAGREQ